MKKLHIIFRMENSSSQQDRAKSTSSPRCTPFLIPNPTQDAKDLPEKVKKIVVKSNSATSLLAKNTILLPSSVARMKQVANVSIDSGCTSKSTSIPSGSATGE